MGVDWEKNRSYVIFQLAAFDFEHKMGTSRGYIAGEIGTKGKAVSLIFKIETNNYDSQQQNGEPVK